MGAFECEGKIGFSFLFIRSPVAGQLMVNSLLVVVLREVEDFGLYSCTVRNISSDFSLQNSSKKKKYLQKKKKKQQIIKQIEENAEAQGYLNGAQHSVG